MRFGGGHGRNGGSRRIARLGAERCSLANHPGEPGGPRDAKTTDWAGGPNHQRARREVAATRPAAARSSDCQVAAAGLVLWLARGCILQREPGGICSSGLNTKE